MFTYLSRVRVKSSARLQVISYRQESDGMSEPSGKVYFFISIGWNLWQYLFTRFSLS